jgi:hypothetical protein
MNYSTKSITTTNYPRKHGCQSFFLPLNPYNLLGYLHPHYQPGVIFMSFRITPTTTVCFPDQQTIINYITNHPLKSAIDTPAVTTKTPHSVEKVSKCFTDRKMSSDAILENIKTALTDLEEKQQLADLEKALGKMIVDIDARDAKSGSAGSNDWFMVSMKEIYSQIQEPDPLFEVVLTIYDTILRDLLDNATFTPPAEGEEVWKRHVGDLTKNNK